MGCCNLGPTAAKWSYLACFTLTALATWILRDYSTNGLSYINALSTCNNEQSEDARGRCLGKGAVLRLSFGNFLFFAAHLVLLLGVCRRADWRGWFHAGAWPLQLLAWAALLGMTFALPNRVFYVWGQIARVLSGFFLVLQLLILIEFVFLVNEWLLERVDRGWAKALLATCAIACYVIALGIIVVVYVFYARSASCSLNIFFITWTLILGLALTGMSVAPWRPPSAGLLTCGAIFAYMAYLVWAALASQPTPSRCIKFDTPTGDSGVKVVGFVLAIAATLYATLNTSMAAGTLSLSDSLADPDAERLPYRYDFFHLAYALASAYLAMLFTGWSLNNVPGHYTVDSGWISVWVKMGSQWLCAALYGWTLLAPLVLRNRQF